ncbi:MAG TPA: hypothetical protein VGD61_16625 [Pyrinomonadaceae bacterium]
MRIAKYRSALIIRTLATGLVILVAFGCNPGLGTITVNATRDFPEMGGLRPIAKYSIYLLNNSITSPEMEEAFKKHMASTTPPAYTGSKDLKESEIRTRFGFMITNGAPIWHKYIVDRVETDYEGNASFKRVKSGDYWLYCMIERPRGQRILWNVKVTVNFYDTTKATINNDNIAFRSDPRPELDQKVNLVDQQATRPDHR